MSKSGSIVKILNIKCKVQVINITGMNLGILRIPKLDNPGLDLFTDSIQQRFRIMNLPDLFNPPYSRGSNRAGMGVPKK